jgi:hypothetical protein
MGENNIEVSNINLKSGVYIINIFSDSFDIVKKIVVIR